MITNIINNGNDEIIGIDTNQIEYFSYTMTKTRNDGLAHYISLHINGRNILIEGAGAQEIYKILDNRKSDSE